MKTHLTINDPSPRFLLVPEVMPKEILPIMDNSMIHYAVGDDVEAGITKMIFVSVQTQRVIEDHFANHPELKCKLDKKTQRLEIQYSTISKAVCCTNIQLPVLGLGHVCFVHD